MSIVREASTYRRDLARVAAAVAIGGVVRASPSWAQTQGGDQSVYNVLLSDPRFTTTMKMLYVAGAANRINGPDRLTVFAATDKAWDNSPFEGLLASLSSNGADTEFPRSMDILEILRGFFVRNADIQPNAVAGKEVQLRSAAGRPIELDGKTMTVKWVAPDGKTRAANVAGQPISALNGEIYPMDVVVGQ
jgi:uncharacterized surface protein with fasciclin (FAS1) repeats